MSREQDIKAYMDAVNAGTISQDQLKADMAKFGVDQAEIDRIMGGGAAPSGGTPAASGGSAPAGGWGDYFNARQYGEANLDLRQAYDAYYQDAMAPLRAGNAGQRPISEDEWLRQHYDKYGKAEGRGFGEYGARDYMNQTRTTEKTPEQLEAIKSYWETASKSSANRSQILQDMAAQGVTAGDIAKAIGANPNDVANALGTFTWGGGAYDLNQYMQNNGEAAQAQRQWEMSQPGAFTTGPGGSTYSGSPLDRNFDGRVDDEFMPKNPNAGGSTGGSGGSGGTGSTGGSGGTTIPGTTIPGGGTPGNNTTTTPGTQVTPTDPNTSSAPMGMSAFWQNMQKTDPEMASKISKLPASEQTRALVQAYRQYMQSRNGTGLLDMLNKRRQPDTSAAFAQGFNAQ
jgi:hypothetical protein